MFIDSIYMEEVLLERERALGVVACGATGGTVAIDVTKLIIYSVYAVVDVGRAARLIVLVALLRFGIAQ